uniref:Uncharacterized protein n=1 Tax=Anguilla anguilla TaxID=7936 RepID=A0A0E9VAE4_ANGAN
MTQHTTVVQAVMFKIWIGASTAALYKHRDQIKYKKY